MAEFEKNCKINGAEKRMSFIFHILNVFFVSLWLTLSFLTEFVVAEKW